jgi:ribosomal protein L6P/L9E
MKENESLEEYVKIFQYNLQRSPYVTLPGEVLKENMIKGMRDEWVEKLNLMGKGDIYQETYEDIVLLCIGCSQGSTQTRSGMQMSLTRNNNISNGGVTRDEVGNLLENFKTNILSTLTTQLDVLQEKQKNVEA